MTTSSCLSCPEFTCACDINECLSTIRLGRISLLNTQVYVHIEKQNGAKYIQAVTSDGSGFVDLDVTDPDTFFFNHFDGLYLVYIMNGGYACDGDKLEVTAPGGTYTTVGFRFMKNAGVQYTTQHIQLL